MLQCSQQICGDNANSLSSKLSHSSQVVIPYEPNEVAWHNTTLGSEVAPVFQTGTDCAATTVYFYAHTR